MTKYIILKKFKEHCELVYTYLEYRNSFLMGYVPYNIFKRRISYITGCKDVDYIRRIFNSLLWEKSIKKKRHFGRVVYLFNPHDIDEEELKPSLVVSLS